MGGFFGVPDSVRRRRLRALLGGVAYMKRSRSRCFICAVVERDPDYPHHIMYEDDASVAFLVKAPQLWGTTLVAPKDHREHVTGDFDSESYVRLQRVVHAVGEGVRKTVPCERLYIMSLGSQQLNRHVHWHVAPLPPGVPVLLQQLRSFSIIAGHLYGPDEEFARLAQAIHENIDASPDRPIAPLGRRCCAQISRPGDNRSPLTPPVTARAPLRAHSCSLCRVAAEWPRPPGTLLLAWDQSISASRRVPSPPRGTERRHLMSLRQPVDGPADLSRDHNLVLTL